ncbi:MAG: VOC family protein [Verrucomicrobiales bacterium]
MPAINARYRHTNLVARDWRRLAKFYADVLGCTPRPPERRYAGEWVGRVTAIPGASLEGIHLLLPGGGEGGPTLEIFQYDPEAEAPAPALNRPGFAHLAFAVDDVPAALEAVLAGGGSQHGALHTMAVPGAGEITLVYAADPEGNVIELQQWTAVEKGAGV